MTQTGTCSLLCDPEDSFLEKPSGLGCLFLSLLLVSEEELVSSKQITCQWEGKSLNRDLKSWF